MKESGARPPASPPAPAFPSRRGSRFETRPTFPNRRPSPRSGRLIDAGDRAAHSRGIGQIAAHDFDAQSVQEIGPAPRANQGPNLIARSSETLSQMAPEQTCGPGDQNAAAARGRPLVSVAG